MIRKLAPYLLSSLLLAVACKDDDDSVSVSRDDVVGVWNVTDIESAVTTTVDVPGAPMTSATATSDLISSTATLEFKDDGTIAGTGSYTYRTEADGVPASEDIVDVAGTRGTWSLDGNVITALAIGDDSNPDNLIEYRITEFSAGERMKWEYTITEENLGGPNFPSVEGLDVDGEGSVVYTK